MKKDSSSCFHRTGTRTPSGRSEHDTTLNQLKVTGGEFECRCGFELLHQATADLMNLVPAYLERHPFVQVRLGEALVRNQATWSAVVREVADPKNQLPEDIKNLLRHLYIYVDANSTKLLNEDDDGDLEMLIMINQNVINGLHLLLGDGA
jgi:flagellar biosynthesis regulator FlaF